MRCVLLLAIFAALCFAQTPALEDLVRKLGHDDFDVRAAAAQALVARGEAARPAIEAALKTSSDAEVRRACADILEQIEARAYRQRLEALAKWPAPPPVPKFNAKRLKPLVEKAGVLSADERWTADRSYRVTATVSVPRGVTLTIDPGAIVLFDEKTRLEVAPGATLRIAGDKGSPAAILTATGEKEGRPRPWGGLLVRGKATLTNVEVRQSEGVVLDSRERPAMDLDRVAIYHTQGCGLTLTRCDAILRDCVVQEASAAGVRISNCRPTLSRCRIAVCKSGVEVLIGSPKLDNLLVTDIQGDGIQLRQGGILRAATVVRAERGVVVRMCAILDGVRVAAIRGNGYEIEGSGPGRLLDITAVATGGAGLFVPDHGTARVGRSLYLDCKGGNEVAAGTGRIIAIAPEDIP